MDSPPDSDFHREAVQAHEGALLRYARTLVGDLERARDVVQDTFLRLLTQPREHVDGHLAEWLYTVCRNRALDVCRKEGRMRSTDSTVLDARAGAAPPPGQAAETGETLARVLALLDRLPPRQSECIRLKFAAGLSYQEISRVTSHSVSYVGVLIHEGMKRLRAELGATRPLAGGRPS